MTNCNDQNAYNYLQNDQCLYIYGLTYDIDGPSFNDMLTTANLYYTISDISTDAYDCAGLYQGESILDDCHVCGGDNTSCVGCDGIVNSGMQLDDCHVCGGDNTSCVLSDLYNSDYILVYSIDSLHIDNEYVYTIYLANVNATDIITCIYNTFLDNIVSNIDIINYNTFVGSHIPREFDIILNNNILHVGLNSAWCLDIQDTNQDLDIYQAHILGTNDNNSTFFVKLLTFSTTTYTKFININLNVQIIQKQGLDNLKTVYAKFSNYNIKY